MSNEHTTVFQEDVSANVDIVLQDKLAKANVTEHTLTQLKEELSSLNIPVTDKASLALVQGGITKAVNIRNLIVRLCKKGRESAIMEQKAWIGKEKELVALVAAVENPLVERKQAYLEEQARIERQENETREARIRERLVAIEGYEFMRKTGTEGREDFYTNGITTIEMSAITMSDDEVWNNLLNSLRMVWEEGQATKAEKERIAAEEAERIRLAQEAIEEGQRRLKEQQDAFNAQVNTQRKNELLVIGYVLNGGELECETQDPVRPKRYAYITDELFKYTAEQWAEELEYAKASRMEQEVVRERIRLAEEAKKAAEARERLIVERVKALKEAGWELGPQPESLILKCPKGEQRYIYFGEGTMLAKQPESEVSGWIEAGRAELQRREDVRRAEEHAQATIKDRTVQLLNCGWERTTSPDQLVLDLKTGSLPVRTVPFDIKLILDDEYFSEGMLDGRTEVERRDKEEKDRIAAEAVEAERKRQEDETTRRAAEEQERLSALTDIQKWNEWVAAIKASAPKLSSEIATHAVGRVLKGLDAMTPNLFVEPKK